MGNKSNAHGIRMGVNRSWKIVSFAEGRSYADNMHTDRKLRDYIESKLRSAGVAELIIKRTSSRITIEIQVARPGVVIGKGGTGIQVLTDSLKKMAGTEVELKVIELKNPAVSAKVVAEEIARQVAGRMAPKAAAQRQIENAKTSGLVKGISIWVAGRIKGAEIARTEKFDWGNIPRHTLRADVDFCSTRINVPAAGTHGIKVWIYRGENKSI